MSNEEIIKGIENGYLLSIEKNKMDPINDESYLGHYNKVISFVLTLFNNQDFPTVKKGSVTESSIPEIARSIFISSGINKHSNNQTKQYVYLPEYHARKIAFYIKRAIKIEEILPSPEECLQIQNQVKDFKKTLFVFVKNEFHDVPDDLINNKINICATALEKGPSDVITITAKRTLNEDQMQLIYSKWNDLYEQNKGTYDSNRTIFQKLFSRESSLYEKSQSERMLSKYIRPFIMNVREEYDKKLPIEFVLPEEPGKLKEMESMFANDLNK